METSLSEDEFAVLNYLDIFKSITDIDSIKISTDLESERIKAILAKFLEEGYVEKEVYGERGMWNIKKVGERVAALHRQLLLEKTGRKDAVIKKCEEFEELNVKFKELVTSWQIRVVDGVPIINDHSDAEYDSIILNKIFSLHEDVKRTLEELASFISMYRSYVKRLDFAIEKLKEGETDYLTKAQSSYHNVWFELHESILKLWGKERIE
jgi:hypothetical protein